MALAFKDELHRLVDEIPETHPEVARVLFELGLLLIFASRNDELLFRRFLREVADLQASAADPDEVMVKLQAMRDRWLHGSHDADDPLLKMLESAPADDEPLTPDEAAILDARRAAATAGPTMSHDELGRKLQA
jgi:hypothetical protein